MLKGLVKTALYRLAAKEEKTIMDTISAYEVVSFDVFDTLLKREVMNPKDVFSIVEKELAENEDEPCKDFAALRMQAERQARRAHPERDITLAEIYEQFPCSMENRKRLMQMEYAVETAVSAQNIPMKEIYDACIRQGKRVLFISDMYLPEEFVRELLRKSGYTEGKLYVSSRSGFTKYAGELFRYVQRQEGIERGRWIHIGDAILSDYWVPKKLGIHSVLVERDPRRNPYVDRKTAKTSFAYRQLNHFIDVHIDRYTDPYERIGYAVLGPLLYGFARWLEQVVPPEETMVFLAREGLIIQRALQILSERLTVYFYISRNAARLPRLSTLKTPNEIEWQHSIHTHTSAEIAQKYGLTKEEAKVLFTSSTLPENKIINTPAEHRKVLQLIWPVVHQKAIVQHELLQRYIEQLELSAECAVIDVGWHGTMQGLLAEGGFTAQGKTIRWNGYYMGLFQSDKDDGLKKTGFLFNGAASNNIHDGVKYSGMFFEMLFLATHGTTKGYCKVDNGKVEPVLGPPDNGDKTVQKIDRIQQAALRFVEDIAISTLYTLLPMDAQTAAGNYLALASIPTLETVNLFSDFEYEDGRKFRFGSIHGLGYYVMHPKEFYNEFLNSQCKTWFLKSVLKVPLPYIQILSFLRSHMKP